MRAPPFPLAFQGPGKRNRAPRAEAPAKAKHPGAVQQPKLSKESKCSQKPTRKARVDNYGLPNHLAARVFRLTWSSYEHTVPSDSRDPLTIRGPHTAATGLSAIAHLNITIYLTARAFLTIRDPLVDRIPLKTKLRQLRSLWLAEFFWLFRGPLSWATLNIRGTSDCKGPFDHQSLTIDELIHFFQGRCARKLKLCRFFLNPTSRFLLCKCISQTRLSLDIGTFSNYYVT